MGHFSSKTSKERPLQSMAMSDEVVLVLAKAIPIDILADEMRKIYFRRLEYPGQVAAIKA